MIERRGVYPDWRIAELIDNRIISGASKKNINPASLNIIATDAMFRVNGFFPPASGESIRSVLKKVGAVKHHYRDPMERDVIYAVRCEERFSFDSTTYAYFNPRSTAGRLNLRASIYVDGIEARDTIPADTKGTIWLVMSPGSFPIILEPGDAVCQLRIFNGDTRFNEGALRLTIDKGEFLRTKDKKPIRYGDKQCRTDLHGLALLKVDLLSSEFAGWVSYGSNTPIHFSKKGYDPLEFFQPLYARKNLVRGDSKGFYILQTVERLEIARDLSGELVEMSSRLGRHRVHQAGWFESGFGRGRQGLPAVLEIDGLQEGGIFRHGQLIAAFSLERMAAEPRRSYDEVPSSQYAKTDEYTVPRLAGNFDMSRWRRK